MGFFDFMGQVLNVVSDFAGSVPASANPNDFGGSQSQYEKMMYRYLYQDCDFGKVLQLLQVAEQKCPNNSFQLQYAPTTNPIWLYYGSQVSNHGVVQVLRNEARVNNFAGISDICSCVSLLVVSAFSYDVIGFNEYKTMKFVYEYSTDLEKANYIAERLQNDNEYNRNGLEGQLQQLQNKYNGWLGYNCFYVDLIIETLQMEQIQNNIVNNVGKYCDWLDGVYSLVLNNAMRIHNASFLQNMRPTQDQTYSVRNSIQQMLVNDFKNASNNMHGVYRDINTCKQQISQMRQLVGQVNDSNIGSHILTGVLTFLNPVLGIANGARTVYGVHQTQQQLDRVSQELGFSAQSLLQNCAGAITTILNSATNTMNNLNQNVSQRYLGNSINKIFETLVANGITPSNNVNDYFC